MKNDAQIFNSPKCHIWITLPSHMQSYVRQSRHLFPRPESVGIHGDRSWRWQMLNSPQMLQGGPQPRTATGEGGEADSPPFFTHTPDHKASSSSRYLWLSTSSFNVQWYFDDPTSLQLVTVTLRAIPGERDWRTRHISFNSFKNKFPAYWDITDTSHCVRLRNTMWWFDTHIYSEMTATIS